jgi:uncharacterized Ntn-hydrolase superfamily protein
VTYSIAAFEPATGELGAAVQSHWFSVQLAPHSDELLFWAADA